MVESRNELLLPTGSDLNLGRIDTSDFLDGGKITPREISPRKTWIGPICQALPCRRKSTEAALMEFGEQADEVSPWALSMSFDEESTVLDEQPTEPRGSIFTRNEMELMQRRRRGTGLLLSMNDHCEETLMTSDNDNIEFSPGLRTQRRYSTDC